MNLNSADPMAQSIDDIPNKNRDNKGNQKTFTQDQKGKNAAMMIKSDATLVSVICGN